MLMLLLIAGLLYGLHLMAQSQGHPNLVAWLVRCVSGPKN
jgi:hypothetical protein